MKIKKNDIENNELFLESNGYNWLLVVKITSISVGLHILVSYVSPSLGGHASL